MCFDYIQALVALLALLLGAAYIVGMLATGNFDIVRGAIGAAVAYWGFCCLRESIADIRQQIKR